MNAPSPPNNLPSEPFFAFIKSLSESVESQKKVKTADNPHQILEIASSMGYEIKLEELRVWSRELCADYFPWAQKGHQWRRDFFRQRVNRNLPS